RRPSHARIAVRRPVRAGSAAGDRAVTEVLSPSPPAARDWSEDLRKAELEVRRTPQERTAWLKVLVAATGAGEYDRAVEAAHAALALGGEHEMSLWPFMAIAATKSGRQDDALFASSHITAMIRDDPTGWVL